MLASGVFTGAAGCNSQGNGSATTASGGAAGVVAGTTGTAGIGVGGAGASAAAGGAGGAGGTGVTASWWRPGRNATFYWDLTNTPPDNGKNVGVYDIDGWNNSAAEITALHALGRKVVCYMDVGTYEPDRPDSSSFPAALKGGAVTGWPDEFWLDVRPSGPSYATLQSIMLARFVVCRDKGFDAVEPDDIDSYQNAPGFPTTAADQLAYNEWIASAVHSLGLAVIQKNDLDQIQMLEPYFDGVLDEECNLDAECDLLAPYTSANKPVWNAEYTDDGTTTSSFCATDATAGIVGALFSTDLDGSVFEPCPNDVGPSN